MRKAWNKLSYDDVKKDVEELGGVLVSTEYINARTKLTFLCSCGEHYETTLANFKTRKQTTCKKCSMGKVHSDQTKTQEDFIKEVNKLWNGQYVVLGEYENSQIKIEMKHQCGFTYKVTPANFLKGRQCPKCVKRVKTKDTEYYKRELREMVGNEYTLLSEYRASRVRVKLKHNVCGFEYLTTPNDFQQGKRCPRCRESKGEKKIRALLEEHKIKFIPQYEFDDLIGIGGRALKFDFAVLKDNSKILIEYDGEFHFKGKARLQKDNDFKTQQIHDRMKNQYCKEHNIKLIRIPYWKFDEIEEILKDAI